MASLTITRKTTLKSLEEICFTHLLTTLEQYPVEVLALLPKAMRSEMLHNLPIVDVCRLEDTQFTAGIDMDAVWKDLYHSYISPHLYHESLTSWRDALFSRMCQKILGDDRPFGRERWVRRLRSCFRVNGHRQRHTSIDCVHYLVAASCVNEFTAHKNLVEVESVVRPSHKYVWPQAKQLVPPRYAKFFPEGNCFLPDSVALDLIRKECHFYPKNIFISTLNVCEFLKYQKDNLGYLIDFFKDVNSLTIGDEGFKIFEGPRIQSVSIRRCSLQHNSKTMKDKAYVAAIIEDVPSKVLQLILSNVSPKLACLRIHINRRDKITSSIAPLLTSAYSGLREFHIHGGTQLDIKSLTCITEFQSMLHTISLSTSLSTTCYQRYRHTSTIITTRGLVAQDFNRLLLSWIQTCFRKPSLVHFQLNLKYATAKMLFQVLVMFLSTPCSHEQTLTFNSIDGVSLQTSCFDMVNFVPPPLDVECPLQFDESYTLPYKSLVLKGCKLNLSFVSSLFVLPPLKLKKLIVNCDPGDLFSVLNQPGFDVQYLEVSAMRLECATLDAFLQKNSLKEVKLLECSSFVETENVHRTASLRGFHVEEGPDQFTLTRQQ